MRREAASVKIQKHYRMYLARNAYWKLYCSAVLIQTCMRGMDALNELKFRKQMRAVIIIQVKDSSCSTRLRCCHFLIIFKSIENSIYIESLCFSF